MPRGTKTVNPKKKLIFEVEPIAGMDASTWLWIRDRISAAIQESLSQSLTALGDEFRDDP